MTRSSIFRTIHTILGRGVRQSEAASSDGLLDGPLKPALGTLASAPNISPQDCVPCVPLGPPSKIGPKGIALIKRFEGCARLRSDGRVEAYPDPGTGGAPWTIGWGATGKGIGSGTIWSRKECDVRLERDLVRYAAQVARALGRAATTQAQFDALVSFHYNTGAIARATLTRRHRAGDYAAALREFARWNRAGGRIMKGLARRRAAEAKLYASTDSANTDSANTGSASSRSG